MTDLNTHLGSDDDFPGVTKKDRLHARVLLRSATSDWSTARDEWTLTDTSSGTDPGPFVCLCHQDNLARWFRLENIETEEVIYIGSSCVNRFGRAELDEQKKAVQRRTDYKKCFICDKDFLCPKGDDVRCKLCRKPVRCARCGENRPVARLLLYNKPTCVPCSEATKKVCACGVETCTLAADAECFECRKERFDRNSNLRLICKSCGSYFLVRTEKEKRWRKICGKCYYKSKV